MTNDKHYTDDLECNNITDKIHSYYQNIQADDEEEVKRITSNAVGYLIRVGWDDMTLTVNEFNNKLKDTTNVIASKLTLNKEK